jgi:hypothetical protein
VVLACLLACALPAPAHAALETIVQDDGVLLYSEPDALATAAARMKLLGVDRVRITANWSVLTRDASASARPAFDARDPAAYEQARWRSLDDAVRAVRAAGMTVMLDVGFWAPHWATKGAPAGPRARTNVRSGDYADFAVAVARRYSGRFSLPRPAGSEPVPAPAEDENALAQLLAPLLGIPLQPRPDPPAVSSPVPLPRVSVFALWNEPNHPALLLPQWRADKTTPASPAVYRRMVQAAYPAIKKVRKGVRLLIGNTSSVGGTRGEGAVAPLEFLRELACVDRRLHARRDGSCAHFKRIPGDGWAQHPYTRNQPPATHSSRGRDDVMLADLPKLARTLRGLVARGRIAPKVARIYLTEFGFETAPVPGRPTVSQANQARWLTWSEYIADRIPAVRSFAQFLLRDQLPAAMVVSDSKARPFGQFSTGLLHADGRPKTAARTFRAGLFAALRDGGRRVLLYGRLRLGPAKQLITLERRVGKGRWKTIARFAIGGQAAFSRTFRRHGDTIYRLTFPGSLGRRKAGLAVRPVARSL